MSKRSIAERVEWPRGRDSNSVSAKNVEVLQHFDSIIRAYQPRWALPINPFCPLGQLGRILRVPAVCTVSL